MYRLDFYVNTGYNITEFKIIKSLENGGEKMAYTMFERNFNSATQKLIALNNTPITANKMADLFFFGIKTLPPIISEYKPLENQKNAIVLLGSSCVGKSTYAKEFLKDHPEFEYLSMDECAEKELKQNLQFICFSSNIMDNSLGFREFGERLEKGQNLIIDGCWLHLNSRSALLKTLRTLNYNITAFSFLTCPSDIHKERIVSRAFGETARELLGVAPFTSNTDWIEEYRKKFKISYDEAIEKIASTKQFEKNIAQDIQNISEEFESSGAYTQITSKLIFIGFHRTYIVL